MKTITVEISDLDEKALLADMVSIEVWLSGVVRSKVEKSKKRIVDAEIVRMISDPLVVSIPATEGEIFDQAIVATAAERTAKLEEALKAERTSRVE